MTPRRTTVTVAAGALTLLTLSGCTKPTPGVTLVSDGERVRTEATLYCRDGQSAQKQDCAKGNHGPRVLSVRSDALVGIDVDKVIAQHGWFVRDAQTGERGPVQNTHYLTFDAKFPSESKQPGVLTIEILSVDHVAEDAKITGTWVFQLVQK